MVSGVIQTRPKRKKLYFWYNPFNLSVLGEASILNLRENFVIVALERAGMGGIAAVFGGKDKNIGKIQLFSYFIV